MTGAMFGAMIGAMLGAILGAMLGMSIKCRNSVYLYYEFESEAGPIH